MCDTPNSIVYRQDKSRYVLNKYYTGYYIYKIVLKNIK